jgi:pyruvate kinase
MRTRSLVMDVRVGESVSVDGGRVVVRVGEKSGQRVKLHFTADSNVEIDKVSPVKGADLAKSGIRGASV